MADSPIPPAAPDSPTAVSESSSGMRFSIKPPPRWNLDRHTTLVSVRPSKSAFKPAEAGRASLLTSAVDTPRALFSTPFSETAAVGIEEVNLSDDDRVSPPSIPKGGPRPTRYSAKATFRPKE
jgi:hypothetical protein